MTEIEEWVPGQLVRWQNGGRYILARVKQKEEIGNAKLYKCISVGGSHPSYPPGAPVSLLNNNDRTKAVE